MCGIFGFHSLKNNDSQTIQITKKLFELSESRGKEASGIALMQNQTITLIKSPEPGSKLVQLDLFKSKSGVGSFHFSESNPRVIKRDICIKLGIYPLVLSI